MPMATNDVIKTMNDLIETSRDGEQGFRTCAQGVTSPNLKTLFEAAARRCAEGAAELEAKVRGLGGQPAQGGSVSGSIPESTPMRRHSRRICQRTCERLSSDNTKE
jgi:uncharacterized protein (TIGR02284 family)